MSNPRAAILIVGDEILSGRTREGNIAHLAGELGQMGIDLCEARIVADHPDAIAEAVRALSATYDHVFTSGGIGPTHDDITAESVAGAFGVPISIREDARALLAAHYERSGKELNEARLRMARIPEGATLIPNPISAAPGFSLGNVHVMAGVPAIFQAMVAELLPELDGGAPALSQTLRIDRPEGEIAAELTELAHAFPALSIGCYPFEENGAPGANVVLRGRDGTAVDEAMTRLAELFGNA